MPTVPSHEAEALGLLGDAIQLAKTASGAAALLPERHPRHQALVRAVKEIRELMRAIASELELSEPQLAAMVTAAERRLH